MSSGQKFVQFGDFQNGAKDAETEDKVDVGDWEDVGAGGGMSVRAGSGMWSWGYVGFEKFEAVGFCMREREGLVKGIIDKAKAVCS